MDMINMQFKLICSWKFRLNVDSEVGTTKTSDFAKRRTITPTSLVKVIPLKSQKVCQTMIINVFYHIHSIATHRYIHSVILECIYSKPQLMTVFKSFVRLRFLHKTVKF
jgi:hypothetical protein